MPLWQWLKIQEMLWKRFIRSDLMEELYEYRDMISSMKETIIELGVSL